MRRCLVVSFAGLALAVYAGVAANPAASKDWPQWRGPNRDAVSTETGLLKEWPKDGPKLLWNSTVVNGKKGLGRGYSSVTVADGRVFTMGDVKPDDFVTALDANTGKELWRTAISPAQGDGPRCTPTVDGERVYAVSRQGELACLSVADGKVLWRKSYKKELDGRMMSDWDYSESPLVDGDKLICTPGGESAALVALNKYNGEVIWKAPVPNTGGSGYASVVVAEVGGLRQYVTLLGKSGGIVGVDAKDGKLLWRYNKMANGTANIPTPIVVGDLVFTSTGYGSGAALLKLVPKDGGIEVQEQYFKRGNELQNHHGGMVRLGDYVYGGHGHNNGMPFCVNLKTGQFAWGPERGVGDGSAAVVYADGNLYFRWQNGVMGLIEATPEGYHVRSSFTLPRLSGAQSWPHPVVANGKLYIRDQDALLCYDVKQH